MSEGYRDVVLTWREKAAFPKKWVSLAISWALPPDSVGLRMGPKKFHFNKFPGVADAAGGSHTVRNTSLERSSTQGSPREGRVPCRPLRAAST